MSEPALSVVVVDDFARVRRTVRHVRARADADGIQRQPAAPTAAPPLPPRPGGSP